MKKQLSLFFLQILCQDNKKQFAYTFMLQIVVNILTTLSVCATIQITKIMFVRKEK